MKKKKNNKIRIIIFILSFASLFCARSYYISASSEIVIETSLKHNSEQRGSVKTIDVRAEDSSGRKVETIVLLNGRNVAPKWDDDEKTSYTLIFTNEGINTVTVFAGTGSNYTEQVYNVNYTKAKKGEVIGQAVWSVELFTIENSYLIKPVYVDIREGETSAETLLRILNENGFGAYYSGSVENSFYLAYISSGDINADKFCGYKLNECTAKSSSLNLTPEINGSLKSFLKKQGLDFDINDYEENWKGKIGEFVFSEGSGWMYSVNNIFPNVSFSDIYLSDGDVVRVQFTLCTGSDIGGAAALGTERTGYVFESADRDRLTSLLALVHKKGLENYPALSEIYTHAIKTVSDISSSQTQIDSAYKKLKEGYELALQNSKSGTKDNKNEKSDNHNTNNLKDNNVQSSSGETNEIIPQPSDAENNNISENTTNKISGEELLNPQDAEEAQKQNKIPEDYNIKADGMHINTEIVFLLLVIISVASLAAAAVIIINRKKRRK